MTTPTTTLLTVIDCVAAGLVEPQAIYRTAVSLMRCRRHQRPVVVFDGPRGALCERCIAERYPESEAADDRH